MEKTKEELVSVTHKSRFCYDSILEIKELDDKLIVKGYIATTHFDGEDIVKKETLQKWAREINEGNPKTNKVSINHNRDRHVAGVGLKGTARIDEFPDTHFGLYVETLVDKTKENYIDTKYRVENGFLDSFSIEYIASSDASFNEDIGARILDEATELHGWTLASRPLNENAVMIKETVLKPKEEIKMTEEEKPQDAQPEPVVAVKESMSKEDKDLLSEYKEQKAKDLRMKEFKEFIKDDEFKKELKEMVPETKPLQNKEETDEEEPAKEETAEEKEAKEVSTSKEFLEFKEAVIGEKDIFIDEKMRRAGVLADKLIIGKEGFKKDAKSAEERLRSGEFKHFGTNGSKLEYKGLGITTNQNSDTDYLLSAAELHDVFDPVIYDVLNQSTTTWSFLRKEDFSSKGNNQVQFILEDTANTTAAFYTGNAVSMSQSGMTKYMTKFKKAQVGIAVDGDMIAAAKGGPVGDVFALHVRLGAKNLLNVINSALYAEVGLETVAALIGFEYITDSAGNTSLYNITRSSANYLSPDSAGDTYISGGSAAITKGNLRLAIQQAVVEGADLGNLVFFCHPTQERLFKNQYDDIQRLVPTSGRVGFTGRMEFDGVPIIPDKDCASDDWFLVDLETHKIAIWVPPTLEMLGKRSDSEEGFIKTYLCTYNTAPRRMVQIYSNATS